MPTVPKFSDILADKRQIKIIGQFDPKDIRAAHRHQRITRKIKKQIRAVRISIVFKEEKLELLELLTAAAEPLKEMMEEKGIVLVMEDEGEGISDKPCYIYADRQWTEEALLNILKNCTEHTPAGGRISVFYSQNPIYTELKIEDSGNGFMKEDLPHIFERFYRGAGAAKDNAGIGLALARAVIEQQNGQIHAENTADGHARFRIKWYHPLLH